MTTEATEHEDREAMTRLQRGEDRALNEIMERHGPRLSRYLGRLLGNAADGGDLAQETFVKVYRHRSKYDPDRRFSTWLYAIATNLVRDRIRWRQRHPEVSLDADRDETARPARERLVADDGLPGDGLQREERAAAVREAIMALKEDLREVVVLAEYEELPHVEIGAILGCSSKAVEMKLYRARKQLKARLAKFLENV